MVKHLLSKKDRKQAPKVPVTDERKVAQKKCKNLRVEIREVIKNEPTKYILFEVNKSHCRKLIETKDSGEKLYCLTENCKQCPKSFPVCNLGYYYHEKQTHVSDYIISVISSMMLSPRELKQENRRQEQILLIMQTPNNYVLCEVKNEHCGKVL